jgi:hypothetical protein
LRMKQDLAQNGHTEGKRLATSLLVGLALVALFAVSCVSATEEQRQDPVGGGSWVGSEEAQAEADVWHPALGNENAPVFLVEYADFQ